MSNESQLWTATWRATLWPAIEEPWDMVIIGGGITGAGILLEATRMGLKTLLVEQRDFAWGTSSRSSKLVHGGLRYLKEGHIGLTRDSVREREQLLHDAPGLVEPLGFLLASYKGEKPGRLVYGAGLTIYDLLARRWNHRYYDAQEFRLLAGQIDQQGLNGGFQYGDAQTDDARLVLRILREAISEGGVALNYARVTGLSRDDGGEVTGLTLVDQAADHVAQLRARVVINATGAWADALRSQLGHGNKIRPLRGSHLIFPAWRLPVAQAVSFPHPIDGRPIFLFPWEGVTLVGTTDEDFEGDVNREPSITGQETAYLMAALEGHYPVLELTLDDITATFAGVRPIIDSGKEDPSHESRDHIIVEEQGMITVTGGKLTTFRLIAQEVLHIVCQQRPHLARESESGPVFKRTEDDHAGLKGLSPSLRRRLKGRYGVHAAELVALAGVGELQRVPGTPVVWAELRWAASAEAVVRLEDLLLRRVRLGLLLPEGGRALLPRIREICQPVLDWSNDRWAEEEAAYLSLWREHYGLPPRNSIPDWRHQLARATQARREKEALHRNGRRRLGRRALVSAALASVLILLASLRRYRHNRDH